MAWSSRARYARLRTPKNAVDDLDIEPACLRLSPYAELGMSFGNVELVAAFRHAQKQLLMSSAPKAAFIIVLMDINGAG